MSIVTEKTKQWCREHKMCKGCPFVCGECVAPTYGGKEEFDSWVEKMNRLIEEVA